MEPLTPADCDLRNFQYMPLDCGRLRDSDLASESTGDEFRAAVMLWCASWHQVPAASLPNSDKTLAKLAGFGHVVKEWLRVKAGAMRNWILCTDGRWYHPVVAEKAREAWHSKFVQQWKTECARIRKHASRHNVKDAHVPEFGEWMSQGCPIGQPVPVPEDIPPKSLASPCETPSNRTEQKGTEGNGLVNNLPTEGSASQGDGVPPEKPKRKARAAETTLDAFIAVCKASNTPIVPEDDAIHAWAESAGITTEMLNLAWAKFKTAHSGKPKKYTDWRATFRNAVKDNWYRLWYMAEDGQMRLTTNGKITQKVEA